MSPHCVRWCDRLVVVVLGAVLLGVCSLEGWADEILSIGHILNDATSLSAHLVTFRGRMTH